MPVLDELRGALGQQYVLEGAQAGMYLRERRNAFVPQALAVVRPGTTDEVAAVVRICAEADIGVVPQSGNSGLVGGTAATDAHRHVVVNLARMDAVRAIDAGDMTMTVEAGCIQADVQQAAAEAGLYFPLTLPSRNECRIGGNLGTNAGGLNVVHYGNTRDLVLGLEVVLADGAIWHGLGRLRKDNSSLDLKHLFIGSEGALGIITAAVFKLFPQIRQCVTAVVGLTDPAHAIALQRQLREASGDNLIACELLSDFAVDLATTHIAGCSRPPIGRFPWYLLVELGSSVTGDWLMQALTDTLSRATQRGCAQACHVASDAADRDAIWRIRESIAPAQVAEGTSIKHDISLPVSLLPAFLDRALPAVKEVIPGVRPCPFGHVGDGNLHFNLSVPKGGNDVAFLARADAVHRVVHDIVVEMGGSIAAEHGIGRLKVAELRRYKSAEEVELLRAIKSALDPHNRMNPGALVP